MSSKVRKTFATDYTDFHEFKLFQARRAERIIDST